MVGLPMRREDERRLHEMENHGKKLKQQRGTGKRSEGARGGEREISDKRINDRQPQANRRPNSGT